MADFKTSNLKAALEGADVVLDWNSSNIQNQLCNGILLNNGTKKVLLDRNTNIYSIIYYARALTISWIEYEKCWKWITVGDPWSGNTFEVAQLLTVTWLDISGKIKASKLLPGIRYEIAFEIVIKKEASALPLPLNLSLKVPNKGAQESQVSPITLPTEKWVEILVGSFTLSDADVRGSGDIEFSMYEHGGDWKDGYVIKSAIIRPNPLS